jgi:class 3 adenylate cyclase/tetratricopeptide (TPR) repeat protein
MTDRPGVANEPAPTGTVTFLFSDIEGSTSRWDRFRVAMQEAVRLHDRLIRSAIERRGGHIFKTVGDAFCAAFARPEAAAAAALDVQRALAAADFTAVDGLRVRIAINTGTADERDGDYFGPALNRVARLLALGHGGQILLSNSAAGLVRENLPPDATLVDLGEHALKDLRSDERVYQLVAPELQRDFAELRSRKASGPWLVPDEMRSRYFTGRDDLLERLRAQLAEHHRAALSGLGGAGKTQAAIEYAVRRKADYPGGVFWVNAETTSGLTSGFVEIAKALRLPAAESKSQEEAVEAALARLNGTNDRLLVLDNVADRRSVTPFVPEGGRGDLLITSRDSSFPELGIPRAIEVRDLAADDAVRFLLARTGRANAASADRAAAAEIARELGYLPLALEQAAAYVAETNATFEAYLSAFRKRRLALLEKAGGLVARDTVAVTWAANFSAVEAISPVAADVLGISSLLAPHAIPFELFLAGARAFGGSIAEELADPDDLAVAELLRPLARYSLIRSDAASRSFGVHRLVQEIVRTAAAEPVCRQNVERAANALDAAFPEVDYPTWPLCERLVPHVEAIAGWVDFYNVGSVAVARLLNRTGGYLRERGRYGEARALHERALAIGEPHLGPEHPEVARILNDLAIIHWYQGSYAEGQAINERALAIRERSLGAEHRDVAGSLNMLGILHTHQGHFDEAEDCFERALVIRENVFGSDHPMVASLLANLGNAYQARGRVAEALSLHERVLAIRERTLEPDHPFLAASLNHLSTYYREAGRNGEALTTAERALAISEAALGGDHPDVGFSLNCVARAYTALGREAEAEALFRRAYDIRERAFGPEHLSTTESLAGLAELCSKGGRHAEAEPLFERALSIRERTLGDHVEVAELLVQMATSRETQGRITEAIALNERAMTIGSRMLPPDHPSLAATQRTLERLRETPVTNAPEAAD